MALPNEEIARILVGGEEISHRNFTFASYHTPNPQFWNRLEEDLARLRMATENAIRAVGWWPQLPITYGCQPAAEDREQAGIRAQDLLCDHLTPQQCEDKGDFGHFWMEVMGRKFCIGYAWDFIYEEDEKGRLASYCLQTADWGFPREDRILAILLLLRHAPEEFFYKANLLWHRDEKFTHNGLEWEFVPISGPHPESTYREWYDRHYHQ